MYHGLIFDLDGTLGNTLPATYRAFRVVFEKYLGRMYTDHEIHAMFGPNEEGVLQRALGAQWEQAYYDYLQAYPSHYDEEEARFPGVLSMLETLLERGVLLGVVTAKGQGSGVISLDLLEMSRFFSEVRYGHAEGAVKPRCIGEVLAAWNLPPEHAVYVGDAPSDIRSAREAGVASVAAAWAPTAEPRQLLAEEPDFFFGDMAAFNEWPWRTRKLPR